MLVCLLAVIAGWYRHRLAALGVLISAFAIQVAIVAPNYSEHERLLRPQQYDLPTVILLTIIKLLVLVLIFYLIGSGLRSLKDRRKTSA